ncbi:class I SAM-dependent methyltransferase [Methylacidimicrobium sp. B4]|uniref:class I SAM-dependent methyltransferase n=1 Tax=Methylacidimicrobium sp. B4 TaxID=2796139 RepID=UPI001A902D82|nr:SAM-dependent methyltransferase [Methylacidimicrobium sp. B4]QSR84631.1 SAM-dependent methyltransferase [Methylacidimicrobium sp. B4]
MPIPEGETPLAALLRALLAQEGSIPFSRFMEIALYHPEHGYYARAPSLGIGRRGDYYTGPSAGPAFGRLFAETVVEVWSLLGGPETIDLWEQGAGAGWLACDLVDSLQRRDPDLAGRLRYTIVEPRARARQEQQERVSKAQLADRFRWVDSWDETERIVGIFLSNELVDSFPVRRLVRRGTGWMESCVTLQDGHLRLEEQPLRGASPWSDPLGEPPPDLPEGWVVEVSPDAPSWMRRVGRLLERGLVFTFDYGLTPEERFSPGRSGGTLRAYRRHRWAEDLLANPGEQDLTAHVDFRVLEQSGREAGLQSLAFIDQHHFFVGILAALAQRSEGRLPDGLTVGGFQTLAHPGFLGRTHQVLIQSKGVDDPSSLSGLRFARVPGDLAWFLSPRPIPRYQ